MAIPRRYLLGGLGLYVGVSASTFAYLKSHNVLSPPIPCECSSADGGTFDRIADRYDKWINLDETLMGLKLLRWWLIRQAEVKVLWQRFLETDLFDDPSAAHARARADSVSVLFCRATCWRSQLELGETCSTIAGTASAASR